MIVVTGGAGFIGSSTVWRLNKLGIRDIIIVDDLDSSDKWKNLVNLDYDDYLHKDIFINMVRSCNLPWKVDAIFHLGACSSTTERDAEFLMSNNAKYTIDLCKFAVNVGARFINASSAATYGDGSLGFNDDIEIAQKLQPLNMYAYSKHLVDLWLIKNRLISSVVSLKFFNVYGPNEYHKNSMRSVIYKAFEQIQKTGKVSLFRSNHPDYQDGEQKRDFVYVKDCVELMIWFLNNKNINGIFNVGTGIARTWNDLACSVFVAMGQQKNITYIDMPMELCGKYQNFTQANMSWLQKKDCPIKFCSIEDGIKDYVRNYLQMGNASLS